MLYLEGEFQGSVSILERILMKQVRGNLKEETKLEDGGSREVGSHTYLEENQGVFGTETV